MPLVLCSLVVLFTAAAASAQQQPPPTTQREVVVAGWTSAGSKFMALAEAFPADKYDYKPTAEVRSFADVVRHVAFWNQWIAATARGEKMDGQPNELSKTAFDTKAKIIAALKQSFEASAAEVAKVPDSVPVRTLGLWSSFTAHTSEHYGQLVVYFRMNGLAPPSTGH